MPLTCQPARWLAEALESEHIMEVGVRSASAETSPSRALLAGAEPSSVAVAIDELISGEWTEDSHGRCFLVGQAYDRAYIHGTCRLHDLFTIQSRSLSGLCGDPKLDGVDLSSVVFLDTETTGLERGGATLVFLVGLLYYQEGRFHVRQYFMDAVAGERTMLSSLCEFLAGFDVLVTFNGKSFDLPMLASRLELQGISHVLYEMAHVDMLYPSRRLWKQRLGSCRLTALERNILGLTRTGDVPGARIPELYNRYRRDGDSTPLLPVFYHNAQDLLTLLALTVEAARVYSDPFGGRVESGLDFYSLGRAYQANGDDDLALLAYDKALSLPLHPADREEVCRRITPLYKRRAQLDHAVCLWEQMVASKDTRGVYPFKELAKYYEHTECRYDRAEALLLEALNLLPRDCCTHTTRRELEKRLIRVQGKLRSMNVR